MLHKSLAKKTKTKNLQTVRTVDKVGKIVLHSK